MRKYHIMMRCRNFLINMDGKIAKHGFIQNFFVEAASPWEAVETAVQRILADGELRAITLNLQNDPPVFDADKMFELESFDEVETRATGKVWYREKKWWQFWK